jgi:AcrR family transcriptional regulator
VATTPPRRAVTAAGADEPPGPLVWTLPEPPGRPAASLSRSAILGAALALADAEGTGGLTMRRVAAELGSSTPMSLYRYVGSKDGLVDLMIDAVYGEVDIPAAPSGDWRADLEPLTLRTWAVIRRHLWFGELVHTRPPFGPHALRYLDFRFAALESQGLDAAAMARITAALDSHLIGSALALAEEEKMRRRTGLATEAELRAVAEPFLMPVLAGGRYPALARWLAGHRPGDLADQFGYTLGCLLDGIAGRPRWRAHS